MMKAWLIPDVERIIHAARTAAQAAQAEQESTPEQAAYWRGYEAALAVIAAAFGVQPTAGDEVRDLIGLVK